MRRGVLLALSAVVAALTLPALGSAHPLGNFTVNTYLRADASGGELLVRYVVDRAEIPTLRERDRIAEAGGLTGYARLQARELVRAITVTVDGRPVRLQTVRSDAVQTPGAAGLETLRVGLWYRATGAPSGGEVRLSDRNFGGRIGWHEALVRATAGAHADAPTATEDRTDELRHYPADLLSRPLDVRTAAFRWSPGTGPARVPGLDAPETAAAHPLGPLSDLAGRNLSVRLVLLALLAAAGWGAIHALSPGHGKSMIAAYLVGSRGTPRHALLLGGFVTITHTLSVIALGLVTLWASELVLPETVFAWVNLAAALLVVTIGGWVAWMRIRPVLRDRARRRAHERAHQDRIAHHRHHDDDHVIAHPHGHDQAHGHDHAQGQDGHGHSHAPPADLSLKGLAAAGASAGLLPCPSAMVLMLGAISVGHVAYGLVLVVAFSLGLAGVLAGIGLLFLFARRFMERLPLGGRVARTLPVLSAIVIVGLGITLMTRALPGVL